MIGQSMVVLFDNYSGTTNPSNGVQKNDLIGLYLVVVNRCQDDMLMRWDLLGGFSPIRHVDTDIWPPSLNSIHGNGL